MDLIFKAALWDNAELLEDLLHGEQILYLNCVDAWGRTPLHAAAITESSQCLRILLQTGADPNYKSGSRADCRVMQETLVKVLESNSSNIKAIYLLLSPKNIVYIDIPLK